MGVLTCLDVGLAVGGELVWSSAWGGNSTGSRRIVAALGGQVTAGDKLVPKPTPLPLLVFIPFAEHHSQRLNKPAMELY